MDSLYLLLPLSVLLVLALIGLFGWALDRGQFDDLEREGARLLEDDAPARPPKPGMAPPVRAGALDARQGPAGSVPEQSPDHG